MEASQGQNRPKGRTWYQHCILDKQATARHPAFPSIQHSSREKRATPHYLSFISRAILWDRGLYHYTAPPLTEELPSPCPRFLAHMRSCPSDLKPPRFLSSCARGVPFHSGQAQQPQAKSAPRSQNQAGQQNSVPSWNPFRRQHVVFDPHIPVHPTGSKIPIQTSTKQAERICQGGTGYSPISTMPSRTLREVTCHVTDAASLTPAPSSLNLDVKSGIKYPGIEDQSESSSSDLNRKGSNQISHDIHLSSEQNSVLSDLNENKSELGSTSSWPCSPSPCCSSLVASCTSLDSTSHCDLLPLANPCCSNQSLHPGHNENDLKVRSKFRFGVSMDEGSCLISNSFTSLSGSKKIPSAGSKGSVSPYWPVLPPITPFRDDKKTGGYCLPQLSPAHLDRFDVLDALVPSTGSALSQNSDLDRRSPDTELSQRTASLALGRDSGDSASLSRVRLLLLGDQSFSRPTSGVFLEQGPHGEDDDESEVRGRIYEPSDSHSSTELSPAGLDVTPEGLGRPLKQNTPPTADTLQECCLLSAGRQESSYFNSLSGSSPGWSLDASGAIPHNPVPWREVLGGGGPEQELQDWERKQREKENKTKALQIYSRLQQDGSTQASPGVCYSRFEDFEFLAKYCIFNRENLEMYKRVFEEADSDKDGYLTCVQVLLALKEIVPPELLSEDEEIYIYRVLELVDFRVADGLTDLRLFAVVASLAKKVAALDDFMRSLIGELDFRSLEVTLRRAKLFLVLVGADAGSISVDQLLVELKAGGIREEHEQAVRRELRHISSFHLLDFLAHLPLFILIHNTVITNPLDESKNL